MIAIMKGLVAALFFGLNTLFWCTLIYVFAIAKFLLPFRAARRFCTRRMIAIGELWIDGNSRGLRLLHGIEFDVRLPENLSPGRSYLICANHQSWVDIVVLQQILNRRIPFLRFFLKHELIYVPFLGLAWWALDFPFMRRHSAEYLRRHPKKRHEDLLATRKACQKFSGKPISIINFLEGTRFTTEKHSKQRGPYRHLLRPKTGGLSFVVSAMGEQFDAVLDATIYYPEGVVNLWGLLSGRMKRIQVDVRRVEIPREVLGRDYASDNDFRLRMKTFVDEIWRVKDDRLEQLEASGI